MAVNLFTGGSLFKRIKGIYDRVVGTATVVCPEVVINKNWNPDSQYAGYAMKVPSKNFYDYIGPYLCQDPALRSGTYTDQKTLVKTKGVGLGQDPYNNDLTRALDREMHSNPGPLAFTMDYSDIPKNNIFVAESIAKGKTELADANISPGSRKYKKRDWKEKIINWEGTWGDTDGAFQTAVMLKVTIHHSNDRVPGGFTGNVHPTGSYGIVWIGSGNDNHADTFQSSAQPWGNFGFKKFFNQYFSSGEMHQGNDAQSVKVFMVPIYRKPFENTYVIRGGTCARAGKYQWIDLRFSICGGGFSGGSWGAGGTIFGSAMSTLFHWLCQLLNLFNIGFNVPFTNCCYFALGNALKSLIEGPINWVLKIINDFMAILLGNDKPYKGSCRIDVDEIGSTWMTLDSKEYMFHPAMRNFHKNATTSVNPTHTNNEHLYTQFYYPHIMKNPLFGYAEKFEWKVPNFKNALVKNPTYNDKVKIEHPLIKKYKYFTPGLFSLLYETNIGVFYEQLSKQLESKGIARSYNIKLSGYQTASDPKVVTNEQKDCLADVIFPTNMTKFNNWIENGYGTRSAKNSGTLSSVIAGASTTASPGSAVPGDYASALGTYGISGGSFGEIDNIMGSFSLMKGLVDANGGDVAKWTQSANTHYKALSTGSPKGLAVKLAQFICWYLEPNGIADRTRSSVRAAVEYEKVIDEQIDQYRAAASCGSQYKNYHIVGTDKYGRNCSTDTYNPLTSG